MSDHTTSSTAGATTPAGERRQGVAVCLSGGGYRAALFHLGALRRLNELGVLAKVDTITSVSGGSIFAAHLVAHLAKRVPVWPPPSGTVEDWDGGVAGPMRDLAGKNIRTGAVLARFKPTKWLDRDATVDVLAGHYASEITTLRMVDLPETPRFVFLATDMQFGAQWVFDSGQHRMGSDEAGYMSPIPDDWTVAKAVAASSCVPILFQPVQVKKAADRLRGGTYQASDRSSRAAHIDLTDGGMYDNLGLEPVWRDHAVVLVCDGAPTYASLADKSRLWRTLRQLVILLDQATEVRKRWLLANIERAALEGAYWSLGSVPGDYDLAPQAPTYPDDLVGRSIARVRIDLDSFSEGEMAVLENHGYLMADLAVRTHVGRLVSGAPPAAQVPHPEWMDADRARAALADSSRIALLGRGR